MPNNPYGKSSVVLGNLKHALVHDSGLATRESYGTF